MQLNTMIKAVAAAAIAVAAIPSQAAYTVLDAWQLVTPEGTTTDIGRLGLTSGTARVSQQVDAAGNLFVGAKFVEQGTVYSISYTAESIPGIGDEGAPRMLAGGESLTLKFSDVMGHVTSAAAGKFSYTFDSGTFTIGGLSGVLASGSIVGIGGNMLSTNVITGTNGDSTILATILNSISGFDVRNSAGQSLLSQFADGSVLFQATTNNYVRSQTTVSACSFDAAAMCVNANNIDSDGQLYLVAKNEVPEPGALALSGLALVGMFAAARRRRQA